MESAWYQLTLQDLLSISSHIPTQSLPPSIQTEPTNCFQHYNQFNERLWSNSIFHPGRDSKFITNSKLLTDWNSVILHSNSLLMIDKLNDINQLLIYRVTWQGCICSPVGNVNRLFSVACNLMLPPTYRRSSCSSSFSSTFFTNLLINPEKRIFFLKEINTTTLFTGLVIFFISLDAWIIQSWFTSQWAMASNLSRMLRCHLQLIYINTIQIIVRRSESWDNLSVWESRFGQTNLVISQRSGDVIASIFELLWRVGTSQFLAFPCHSTSFLFVHYHWWYMQILLFFSSLLFFIYSFCFSSLVFRCFFVWVCAGLDCIAFKYGNGPSKVTPTAATQPLSIQSWVNAGNQ